MKEFSKELRDMLTDFIVSEIGSKGIDGITYTMKLNNSKNADDIKDYIKIREEAYKCGYDKSEVFRAFELSNGIVFDMDIKAMTHILVKIAESAANITGKHGDMSGMIYSEPTQVRKKELVRLAKEVHNAYEKGENTLDVALFNRNRSSVISFVDKNDHGATQYTIKAFKARIYDIAAMNAGPLSKSGITVTGVTPKYILPYENGVVTSLEIEQRN